MDDYLRVLYEDSVSALYAHVLAPLMSDEKCFMAAEVGLVLLLLYMVLSPSSKQKKTKKQKV